MRVLAAVALAVVASALGIALLAAALGLLEEALVVPLLERDLVAVGMSALEFSNLSCLTVLLPLPAVASAVVYEALREAKEAPREGELARVFE